MEDGQWTMEEPESFHVNPTTAFREESCNFKFQSATKGIVRWWSAVFELPSLAEYRYCSRYGTLCSACGISQMDRSARMIYGPYRPYIPYIHTSYMHTYIHIHIQITLYDTYGHVY